MKQTNLLPLPPGRTLIFERDKGDTEGSFVCSACRKDFPTSDPAEVWHNSICIIANIKKGGPMENFDKYDEIDYTGKSDPNIGKCIWSFSFPSKPR